MEVRSSEDKVLKVLWDATNGREERPVRINRSALVRTIQSIQRAGVRVYPGDGLVAIEKNLIADVRLLEALGFVKTYSDQVWLNGAGELVARTIEFPDGDKAKLEAAGIGSGSTRPA